MWVAAYVVAASAVLLAAVAIVVVAAALTEANAPAVRVALFGGVPLLALVAVMAAATASGVLVRRTWIAAAAASVGIVLAGAAHVAWYAEVDAVTHDLSGSPWPLLVIAATVAFGTAIAALLAPSLRRSSLRRSSLPGAAAVALAAAAGLVGGATLTALLFVPIAGPSVALLALATVIVLHRVRGRMSHVPSRPVAVS
jgi:hypothetical protein